MTTDTGTEAAIIAKAGFYAAVAALPAAIRDDAEENAWSNSWGAECFEASKTNEDRWNEATRCLALIAASPADYI